MKRVIWLVLDSFGVGNAKDAASFGDMDADTLGSIAKNYKLKIPNLCSLGLLELYKLNNNKSLNLKYEGKLLDDAFYGVAKEKSLGKDTLSGHWEMCGTLMDVALKFYEDTNPAFPQELLDEIIDKCGLEGTLANRHASGVEVINTFAKEHIQTNKPIFYTSADSVIQIAAHEEHFGLDRLYKVCEITREITKPLGVGRVIARPFLGNEKDGYQRTKNRRDYSIRPNGESVLEIALKNQKVVIGVGKIFDIFAGNGISKKALAYKIDGLANETLKQMGELKKDGIIYTNFVDFDMEYGHRRDVVGYAKALEEFDLKLKEIIENLQEGDFLILTADHGCDPTFKGNDHTRENVPVFGIYKNKKIKNIGIRETFADMGASIASHLEIPSPQLGISFI